MSSIKTTKQPRPGRPGSRVAAALALATLFALGACTTTTTGGLNAPPPAAADKRAQVRVELASNYFERGQNDVALEEIKRAIDADPSYAPAYSIRGLIEAALGDAAGAESSFRRAMELDPRDGFVVHNYGWFLCQQGRYAVAHERFDAALKMPTYRDPIRTLLAQGVCYGREAKWTDAERVLSRAYEMDVGNPAVGYNLAQAVYRRGDYERARFMLRRINQNEQFANAQTLWLALRVEHRLGHRAGVTQLGQQLRSRFPQAPETQAFERGRFDD